MRNPRIVRVAVIQNSIVNPTTDPLAEQYAAIEAKVISSYHFIHYY